MCKNDALNSICIFGSVMFLLNAYMNMFAHSCYMNPMFKVYLQRACRYSREMVAIYKHGRIWSDYKYMCWSEPSMTTYVIRQVICQRAHLSQNNFVRNVVPFEIFLSCIYTPKIWPRNCKTFQCSSELSMRFIQCLNVTIPRIVGTLVF